MASAGCRAVDAAVGAVGLDAAKTRRFYKQSASAAMRFRVEEWIRRIALLVGFRPARHRGRAKLPLSRVRVIAERLAGSSSSRSGHNERALLRHQGS